MQPILASIPALSVSIIFCLHNVCRQFLARRAQRQWRLRQRVAQLLWVMATRSE
jgi:hypothetical protein